jgi:hypothetical protein
MRRGVIVTSLTAAILAGPAAGSALADFVCPVLPVSGNATTHERAGFITISGGDTSILPGIAGDDAVSPVDVPSGATNDEGAGSPGGSHDSPGDTGYTGIWNT